MKTHSTDSELDDIAPAIASGDDECFKEGVPVTITIPDHKSLNDDRGAETGSFPVELICALVAE
jgi:hypothetical protein